MYNEIAYKYAFFISIFYLIFGMKIIYLAATYLLCKMTNSSSNNKTMIFVGLICVESDLVDSQLSLE